MTILIADIESPPSSRKLSSTSMSQRNTDSQTPRTAAVTSSESLESFRSERTAGCLGAEFANARRSTFWLGRRGRSGTMTYREG